MLFILTKTWSFFFKQSLLNLILLRMCINLMSGISSPPVFSWSWMQTMNQGFPLFFKTCGDGTENRTVFEIFHKEQNNLLHFFYFIPKLSNKMSEMVQLLLISKCFLKVRKCHLILLHSQSQRVGCCSACVREREAHFGGKNPEDFAFLFEEISIITHAYISANIAESWGDCKFLKVKVLMF